jgi:hypothetical protein
MKADSSVADTHPQDDSKIHVKSPLSAFTIPVDKKRVISDTIVNSDVSKQSSLLPLDNGSTEPTQVNGWDTELDFGFEFPPSNVSPSVAVLSIDFLYMLIVFSFKTTHLKSPSSAKDLMTDDWG